MNGKQKPKHSIRVTPSQTETGISTQTPPPVRVPVLQETLEASGEIDLTLDTAGLAKRSSVIDQIDITNLLPQGDPDDEGNWYDSTVDKILATEDEKKSETVPITKKEPKPTEVKGKGKEFKLCFSTLLDSDMLREISPAGCLRLLTQELNSAPPLVQGLWKSYGHIIDKCVEDKDQDLAQLIIEAARGAEVHLSLISRGGNGEETR